MAIGIQDIAGNATVTTSGTVNAVTSPVAVGGSAIQFNTVSSGTVSDGDGKFSFVLPNDIGTGDFTIEMFVSVSKDGGSYHHADYFIDIGGIECRVKTITGTHPSLGANHLQWNVSNLGYGSFLNGSVSTVNDESYIHFQITRQSGTVKFWENTALEQTLATGNTDNMNGVTIEVGDLGTGSGCLRVDAFRVSNTVRNGADVGTSYTVPGTDSTTELVEADTVVLITGQATEILDATISTSASVSVSATTNTVMDAVISMNSAVFFASLVAGPVENATANLNILADTGERYVELGYIESGYFEGFEATAIRGADIDISASLVTAEYILGDYVESGYFFQGIANANLIAGAQVTENINLFVGEQDYVDTTYIEVGYFVPVVEVEDVERTINISITSSMSITAEETAEISVDITASTGDLYVEGNYIEGGYFSHVIEANVLRSVDATLPIALSVAPTAIFIADGTVLMDNTLTVSADGDTISSGVSTVAIQSTASVEANVSVTASVATAIQGTVGITAFAELAGEVSVSIAATTSISVIAVLAGDIQSPITTTLTVSAQVFRLNPRYTLLIPKETRVNTITQETRTVQIPKQTRELEFLA